MPGYTWVTVQIQVKLFVPADGEYDVESYFEDLKTHIEDQGDNHLNQVSEPFIEVDDIEVTLLNPTT